MAYSLALMSSVSIMALDSSLGRHLVSPIFPAAYLELSRQANGGMTHWCRQTKHVTCTAAVVDMVMGAVGGLLVVQHQSWITHFVQRMVRMLTNDILHTGCIWLMGMPAGFKDDDSSQPEWGQFGCM